MRSHRWIGFVLAMAVPAAGCSAVATDGPVTCPDGTPCSSGQYCSTGGGGVDSGVMHSLYGCSTPPPDCAPAGPCAEGACGSLAQDSCPVRICGSVGGTVRSVTNGGRVITCQGG
jgi:hypothetical protein